VASSLELASRLVIIHPPILPPLELGRMTTDHELDLGYLDEGVEFVGTRSSTEQRERVLSDDCDVALTAIDNLIARDADGDDLRLVA
jgi:hypothetical protein